MRKILLILILIGIKLNAQVNASVQLAGGDNAWHAARPTATPLARQVVLNTSTGQWKVGDGVTQLQNLPYYGINGTGFVKSTGTVVSYDPSTYLTTEVDGSITNELQALSRSDQTVTLSNTGGSITVQPPLNGTGFVKATGTVISYDNSTYLTTSSASSVYFPYSGATGSATTQYAISTPSLYGPTSTSVVNIFSNPNGSGTINLGSGTGTVTNKDLLYQLKPISFGTVAAASTTVNQIYRSGSTADGITINSDPNTNGITIRDGSKKLQLYADSTVSNPNGQINMTGGGLGLNVIGGGAITIGSNGNIACGVANYTPVSRVTISAGSSTIPAISLAAQTAVSSPTNGQIWYETTRGFVHAGRITSTAGYSAATSSTLNGVVNQSTLTVGNTNTLTGGNSGTIAVFTDCMFTTTHFHGLSTVGTTTFFYDKYPSSSGITSASGGVGVTVVPFNCTLAGFAHSIVVFGTLGTANTATVIVRVNNTTDITLTSSALYSTATSRYSSSALNTNLNAGDYIEVKVIPNCTPTSATNVTEATTLFFTRR